VKEAVAAAKAGNAETVRNTLSALEKKVFAE